MSKKWTFHGHSHNNPPKLGFWERLMRKIFGKKQEKK